jgi:hypothetical protein
MARKGFCGSILITLVVLGFILGSCNPDPGEGTKSDNAVLASIAGQEITPTGGDGTLASPKIASIGVSNSKETIAAGDVEIAAKATMTMYSDTTFTTAETTFALPEGIAVNIYIKVTAEDGTTVMYYHVALTRSLPESIKKTLTITGISLTGTVTALLDENGGPNLSTTYIASGQAAIISQTVTFQLKAQDNTDWTGSGSYLVYLFQEEGEYKYWLVDDPPGETPEKVSFTSGNTEIAWSRFRGFDH